MKWVKRVLHEKNILRIDSVTIVATEASNFFVVLEVKWFRSSALRVLNLGLGAKLFLLF